MSCRRIVPFRDSCVYVASSRQFDLASQHTPSHRPRLPPFLSASARSSLISINVYRLLFFFPVLVFNSFPLALLLVMVLFFLRHQAFFSLFLLHPPSPFHRHYLSWCIYYFFFSCRHSTIILSPFFSIILLNLFLTS